jgi:hypothetical protein
VAVSSDPSSAAVAIVGARIPPIGAQLTLVAVNLWSEPETLTLQWRSGDFRHGTVLLVVAITSTQTLPVTS